MRTYDLQLLNAPDLSTPAMLSSALQLQQLAQDAYTGRTIPPNQSPQPIPGSAGAYQAFTEAQYMATLDVEKYPWMAAKVWQEFDKTLYA